MGVLRTISDEELARYILGESTDAEREIVEDAYFSDQTVHDRLMGIEEEIFDAYARGYLNPRQREHFQALFLHTDEGRERLHFSRALCRAGDVAHSTTNRRAKVVVPAADVRPVSPRSQKLFFFRFAVPVAFAAVFLMAIIVPLMLRRPDQHRKDAHSEAHNSGPNITSSPSRSSSQSAPSRTSTQTGRESRDTLPLFAFDLIPSTRDSRDRANRITIPRTPVVIRLKIALERIDYPRYRVLIQRPEGGSKLSFAAHKLGRSPGMVYVDIASRLLKIGDYVLDLQGVPPNGTGDEIGGYTFRVERQ
jgi:hypothetical protein